MLKSWKDVFAGDSDLFLRKKEVSRACFSSIKKRNFKKAISCVFFVGKKRNFQKTITNVNVSAWKNFFLFRIETDFHVFLQVFAREKSLFLQVQLSLFESMVFLQVFLSLSLFRTIVRVFFQVVLVQSLSVFWSVLCVFASLSLSLSIERVFFAGRFSSLSRSETK